MKNAEYYFDLKDKIAELVQQEMIDIDVDPAIEFDRCVEHAAENIVKEIDEKHFNKTQPVGSDNVYPSRIEFARSFARYLRGNHSGIELTDGDIQYHLERFIESIG